MALSCAAFDFVAAGEIPSPAGRRAELFPARGAGRSCCEFVDMASAVDAAGSDATGLSIAAGARRRREGHRGGRPPAAGGRTHAPRGGRLRPA
mmetsp:Transcript_74155/g.209931  ORF Transcript_74155/g.209931 Transcript_74155/m.209931 type:complete len:93 (-) Transcript_74155:2-280(-)